MTRLRNPLTLLLISVFVASGASAVITFTQLDANTFTVSHRVKGIGSRGKAMRLVYEKAASLCLATGHAYYRVLDQESQAANEYESANATVRVQFYFEDGNERIACEGTANPDYVAEASAKLAQTGYVPPSPTPKSVAGEGGPLSTCASTCTIAQVAAMARAGLSDEQIEAACGEGDTGDGNDA